MWLIDLVQAGVQECILEQRTVLGSVPRWIMSRGAASSILCATAPEAAGAVELPWHCYWFLLGFAGFF